MVAGGAFAGRLDGGRTAAVGGRGIGHDQGFRGDFHFGGFGGGEGVLDDGRDAVGGGVREFAELASLLVDLYAGEEVDGEGGEDDDPHGAVEDGDSQDVPFGGDPAP